MRIPLVLLAAVALVAPAMPAASEGTAADTFYWALPADHEGPVVVRMTFDFGEANACSFRVASSGEMEPSPIFFWEEWSTWGRGGFYSTYTAQAHLTTLEGVDVDTREVRGRGGQWALQSTSTGAWSGIVTYTYVGFAPLVWTNSFEPSALVIDVECDAPFTVGDFGRGNEAVAFTADSMRGDYGASAQQLFGSATVLENGRLHADFTHEEVQLRMRMDVWTGISKGTLALDTPQGDWDLAWQNGSPGEFARSGGPGAYDLELDYVAAGLDEGILGALYALDAADSLDG